MAQQPNVALTREGAVGGLKLVMIVLAALIFWAAASAVSQQFQESGLTTAAPFVRGAARLLVGTDTDAPFQRRLWEFWGANHRVVAVIATLAAVTLLSARFLAFGRVFDYLYLESEVRDRRIYSGFATNIFLTLLHAGTIYGLILLERGAHATLVPLGLLTLLIVNLAWYGCIFIMRRPVEHHPLRGLKFLAITTGAAAVLLFAATWMLESRPASNELMRGSATVLLTALAAIVLCFTDALVQSLVYFRKPKPVPPPPV